MESLELSLDTGETGGYSCGVRDRMGGRDDCPPAGVSFGWGASTDPSIRL